MDRQHDRLGLVRWRPRARNIQGPAGDRDLDARGEGIARLALAWNLIHRAPPPLRAVRRGLSATV
jgi:hypothetical protein